MKKLLKPVKPSKEKFFLRLDISDYSDFESLYDKISDICNIHNLEFSDFSYNQHYEECYYDYSILESEESYQKRLQQYEESMKEYELQKLTFDEDLKNRKIGMCKRALQTLENKKVEILKQLEELENLENGKV